MSSKSLASIPSTEENPPPGPFWSERYLKNFTLEEIVNLPQEKRDELAQDLNVACWDPFTVLAICTPGDAYPIFDTEIPDLGPIPDEDEDENTVPK